MNSSIIELNNLTKKYENHTAVNQLTLNIQRGEIFGLLGPNGAGKSTTILMLLGLTEPTSGSVHVCGLDSTRQPIEVKKRIGYLPDDVGFYEDLSGLENLMFTARLNRMSDVDARAKAIELLQIVGLMEAANNKTSTYSRGMRQRLGLADVLTKSPEIIILDEPTLGIDPKGVKELLTLIQKLSRENGITVLLSSHHLHQVQQICDRVGLFVQGQLIAEGDISSLSKQLFKNEQIMIDISVASRVEEARSLLENHEQVVSVEVDTFDANLLHLYCQTDCTIAIANQLHAAGLQLTHLSRINYGLDDIYHRYFEGGGSDEGIVIQHKSPHASISGA